MIHPTNSRRTLGLRVAVYGSLIMALAATFGSRPLAVLAIDGYQRYISPYKGYRCAATALHGGPSCSQYVKQTIAEHGVIVGVTALRERSQQCHEAALSLRNVQDDNCQPQPRVDECFETDRERGKREAQETKQYCAGCFEGLCSSQ